MILLVLESIFQWQNLTAFLLGITLGCVLVFLLYIYAVIKGMRREMKRRHVQELDVDEKEIQWLIDQAIADFQTKEKELKNNTYQHLLVICKDLASDIASKFYPKSSKPLLELSIDETLALIHYITNRVDELLNAKIIRLFRGLTIKRIMDIKEASDKVTKSKVYELAKDSGAGEAYKSFKVIKPLFWIRKVTVDPVIKVIIKKMSLNIIQITGEETYQIYSKKVFEAPISEELLIDNIYDEIQKKEIGDLDV